MMSLAPSVVGVTRVNSFETQTFVPGVAYGLTLLFEMTGSLYQLLHVCPVMLSNVSV